MKSSPLLDKEFLKLLDEYPHKEKFVRITSLTWAELPIECIEGRVTGGSISVDGTSAVRRTCNLTLVAEDINISNVNWGITHKFCVEIGLKNDIDSDYSEIIWFKLGIFVITTFNIAYNVTSYTISISGKDKMCLLNGDVGGNLTATTNFSSMDVYDTRYSEAKIENESAYKAHKYYTYDPTSVYYDTVTMKWLDGYVLADGPYDALTTYYNQELDYSDVKIPIREILREAIHTYASEPYHKIIINDLEDYALELLEYRNADAPLYVIFDITTLESRGIFYDGNVEVYNAENDTLITLAQIPEYDNFVEGFNLNATKVYFPSAPESLCTVEKLEYGDTAGFRQVDLIYPEDLIANAGESFTSVLDKIKNLLGLFEYFYDLDGYFIFLRKKVFADISWNPTVDGVLDLDDVYIMDAVYTSPDTYSLTDNMLITAFNNNPNILNLKNDYSIHGKRKTANNVEIPIHYRFAIDHKPKRYLAFPVTEEQSIYLTTNFPESFPYDTNHDVNKAKTKYQRAIKTFVTEDYEIDWTKDANCIIVDWRELIYLMALDYHKYHEWDEFLYLVELHNPTFLGGITDYERYYVDVLSFWRELYCPDLDKIMQVSSDGGYYIETILYTRDDNGNIVNDGTYNFTTDYRWVNYTEKEFDLANNYFLPASAYNSAAKEVIEVENTMIYLLADTENKHILKWYLLTELQENDFVKLKYEVHRLLRLTDLAYTGTMIVDNPVSCGYSIAGNEIQYDTLSSDNTVRTEQLKTHYYKWTTDNTAAYFWEDRASRLSDIKLTGNYDNLLHKYYTIYYKIRGVYTNEETNETHYTKWSNVIALTFHSISTQSIADSSSSLIEQEIINYIYYPHNASDLIKSTSYAEYLKHFNEDYKYWNMLIQTDPSKLNFWIDFLDTDGDLGQYSVPFIGDRTKVIKDDKVTSIYFKETPNIVYVEAGLELNPEDINTGYKYVYLPSSLIGSFEICALGKSAKETLDELLYLFSYSVQNASITCVPIYYLDVNTRIFIFDAKSGINGEYIVDKFNVPLAYNGTMSITAHKAVERLY